MAWDRGHTQNGTAADGQIQRFEQTRRGRWCDEVDGVKLHGRTFIKMASSLVALQRIHEKTVP